MIDHLLPVLCLVGTVPFGAPEDALVVIVVHVLQQVVIAFRFHAALGALPHFDAVPLVVDSVVATEFVAVN